jgi:uncharacterized membrane protein YagU involved in acid resistance
VTWRATVRQALLPGALAGLAGGAVSGAALAQVGALPSTAALVQLEPAWFGLAAHLAVCALLGAGFGLLLAQQRHSAGESLFWGATLGTFWWFLGPLTLLPLVQLGIVTWDIHSTQEAWASLIGHLLFGVVMGLALAALRRGPRADAASPASVLARGLLAGGVGAVLLQSPAGAPAPVPTPLVGVLAGLAFVALYPRPPAGTGPAMVRGTLFGFLWWILWPLTLMPAQAGAGLAWALDDARAAFTALPPYMLAGAAVAVAAQWLDGLNRLLFTDMPHRTDEEGLGTEGLRAIGRGALAGLAGGVIFTIIMTRVEALGAAARLVGARSDAAGVVVQLLIANVIGVGYGLLFRRQSFDAGSALGWGVAYGFFWWVLGPLTLTPLLLGAAPQWSAAAAAAQFGSLIGHLAYGAALGIAFHLLETRHNPWWLPRTRAEAARVARRKEGLLTSAPAVWALVVVVALTLPILLAQ